MPDFSRCRCWSFVSYWIIRFFSNVLILAIFLLLILHTRFLFHHLGISIVRILLADILAGSLGLTGIPDELLSLLTFCQLFLVRVLLFLFCHVVPSLLQQVALLGTIVLLSFAVALVRLPFLLSPLTQVLLRLVLIRFVVIVVAAALLIFGGRELGLRGWALATDVERQSWRSGKLYLSCGAFTRSTTSITLLHLFLNFIAKLWICVLLFGRHC